MGPITLLTQAQCRQDDMGRRSPTPKPPSQLVWLGVLIGLIGVINVVLALSLAGRGQMELLRQHLVSYAIDGGRVSLLITGFLLL